MDSSILGSRHRFTRITQKTRATRLNAGRHSRQGLLAG